MGIQNGGGNAGGPSTIPTSGCGARATGGGGASGVMNACASRPMGGVLHPEIYIAAGAGGGSGYVNPAVGESSHHPSGTGYPDIAAGGGGGLVGGVGGFSDSTSNYGQARGGGGDQEQGGQAGGGTDGASGSAMAGGRGATCDPNSGGGGDGFYGGGGGGSRNPTGPSDVRTGGGGSSYYGHPQITSGSTEEGGPTAEGGGTTQPGYVAGTNEGKTMAEQGSSPYFAAGEDGYVLITGGIPQAQSTTIVSNAFTAGSAPSTSRIVVFQENIDSITVNTDLIASVSRDGGSNFSTVTLVDEGYVTGASGQRILAGIVDISGQPSGTSMRWKLALANNQSKVHGVSLSWA